MIPARMGSQRLKYKNLQKLNGVALISHAIRKSIAANIFDEIWVNSEDETFGEIAMSEGVKFHKRPAVLANNEATSEDFVYEFLKAHECDYVVQVHSIAPLLKKENINKFVSELKKGEKDILLSVEDVQIECVLDGQPLNFTFDKKTNSQDLIPIQRITWSITAWKRDVYIKAYESKRCATYAGSIGYFVVNKLASHIIKTQADLDVAQALMNI